MPAAILDFSVLAASFGMVDDFFGGEYSEEYYEEDGEYDAEGILEDHTAGVELGKHSETMQGLQLLIQSTIKNNSKKSLNSIEIEAELFDADGNFVYECSEYINNKIESGAVENIQIKCGCSKNGIPKYETITLKVTSARIY